jgi:hypothetical protein
MEQALLDAAKLLTAQLGGDIRIFDAYRRIQPRAANSKIPASPK